MEFDSGTNELKYKNEKARSWPQPPRVIAVTSGKGGVGKTNFVANLGLALTQKGKNVLLLDADLGLGSIHILLGVEPRFSIEHLLKGEKPLAEVVVRGPGGMLILPSGYGAEELAHLDEKQRILLLAELDLLEVPPDFMLIDTGPGISPNVLYFNLAAQESIVITTPEPTSVADTYALLKVLASKSGNRKFWILVNECTSDQEAMTVFESLARTIDCFVLNLSIDYLGLVPPDPKLSQAVRNQRLVLEANPIAPSSLCFREIAGLLCEMAPPEGLNGNPQFFARHISRSTQSLESPNSR